MSQTPTGSQGVNEEGAYYMTRAGPTTQMARPQYPASGPYTLPPPSKLANPAAHLPPPSHLDPPFVPQSPQVRPQYSDIPTRHQPSYPVQQHYDRPSPRLEANARWPATSYSSSHPQLYAQKVSYQSTNPGTLYEAISPVGYPTFENPGRASMFDEGTYTGNPHPASNPQPQHSPAGSYHSSATTSSSGVAPAPIPLPRSTLGTEPRRSNQDVTNRYEFYIRQQPIAARACGFGERDRRVIDPPPIVQLALRNFDPKSTSDVQEIQWPFNVVHCALLSAPPASSSFLPSSDVTAVPDPNQSNRLSRRLMGTLVSSPFIGVDPEAPISNEDNARLACFFVFPDLSCRQNGLYKLRFTLMKLDVQDLPEGGQGNIVGSVDSDVFEVFSAKDFPGMRASTTLTKELKRQGAAISVKKGKGWGGQKRGSSDSERSRSGSEGTEVATEAPMTSATAARQRKKRG